MGSAGRFAVANLLPHIKREHEIDLVIANGENCSSGMGLIEKDAKKLFHYGIDIITTGNHFWDKYVGIEEFIEKRDPNILRPINYPKINPGKGYLIHTMEDGTKVGVINAQGRVFMPPIDCPFTVVEEALPQIQKETNIIFMDFHAEASAEKIAMAMYFDESLSAFVGTHTHIQTNDLRITENGTGYVTDAGMCGAFNSILGFKAEESIYRFRYQRNKKFVTAKGDTFLNGVVFSIDKNTGKTVDCQLITEHIKADS